MEPSAPAPGGDASAPVAAPAAPAQPQQQQQQDRKAMLAPLLPYEQQMVEQLIEEDALCIMAAGLGWQKVRPWLLML